METANDSKNIPRRSWKLIPFLLGVGIQILIYGILEFVILKNHFINYYFLDPAAMPSSTPWTQIFSLPFFLILFFLSSYKKDLSSAVDKTRFILISLTFYVVGVAASLFLLDFIIYVASFIWLLIYTVATPNAWKGFG